MYLLALLSADGLSIEVPHFRGDQTYLKLVKDYLKIVTAPPKLKYDKATKPTNPKKGSSRPKKSQGCQSCESCQKSSQKG